MLAPSTIHIRSQTIGTERGRRGLQSTRPSLIMVVCFAPCNWTANSDFPGLGDVSNEERGGGVRAAQQAGVFIRSVIKSCALTVCRFTGVMGLEYQGVPVALRHLGPAESCRLGRDNNYNHFISAPLDFVSVSRRLAQHIHVAEARSRSEPGQALLGRAPGTHLHPTCWRRICLALKVSQSER